MKNFTTTTLILLVLSVLSKVDSFVPRAPPSPVFGVSDIPSTRLCSTTHNQPTSHEEKEISSSATSSGSNGSTSVVPRIQNLKSLEEFLNYIDSAPQDSLAVVKFYAKSCPLCKKIELKYKKMARFYQTAPIQFAEIEKTVHPDLFVTLGVETYPFIQIYRNGQCVAAHGTESDKMFEPIVNDTIQRELTMTAEDWNTFLTTFEIPIRASTEKLNSLRVRQTSPV
mmetsp:Transcript_36510/g.105171  ORF Transcript_36510/g.105171 Transcript_36510/m.105171 type:complete len:225 (+) Transcript_36510:45-719(+)